MDNIEYNVNVKIDAEVKELATKALKRMGIDQATAIDMLYRWIIAENTLPFCMQESRDIDEQIVEIASKKDIPSVTLLADTKGNLMIDKELHPDIYEWAVNG